MIFVLNGEFSSDLFVQSNCLYQLQRYDCGVSQHYEMESHGGTTFCAIAALHLSGQMDTLSESTRDKLIRWLIFRQVIHLTEDF